MFNPVLFFLFMGYIISLLVGFSTNRDSKQKLNKYYDEYKFYLLLGIVLIFILISTLLLTIINYIEAFFYVLVLNGIFVAYFLILFEKRTRCWKQHRMVIYNFLAIPIIYFASLLLSQPFVLFGVLPIYIYSLFEFQFAKFDPKKPFLWD